LIRDEEIIAKAREAIREAIHDTKKGSREPLPIDELRTTMRDAIGLE
jgi:hypothetical protein